MISPDDQSSIDMIRQSAGAIARRGDLGRVRRLRFLAPGFDRGVWQEICDAGWPALRVPEEKGGIGLGMLAYCALMEELGAVLVPEPLIAAIFVASLLDGESLEQQIAGARLILPAWQDERDAHDVRRQLLIDGGKLNAVKHHVPVADGANAFLVIGASQAALVPADAKGVHVTSFETQDGARTARISFADVAVEPFNIDPVPSLAEAALASSAYMLGLMDAALDLTVEYLKTRLQFGKPIGTFQALQHMAVDARLEVELTRASVEEAAVQWDRSGSTPANLAAVSRAKVRASQAVTKVTRDAIQMHGGIGFTDEHDIGLFMRKAIVVSSQFGSAKAHRTRFAELKPVRVEV